MYVDPPLAPEQWERQCDKWFQPFDTIEVCKNAEKDGGSEEMTQQQPEHLPLRHEA